MNGATGAPVHPDVVRVVDDGFDDWDAPDGPDALDAAAAADAAGEP